MGLNNDKDKGRIRYIEPTNTKWVDGIPYQIQSNEDINNPLEDYCLAVDLQVIIPERKSCGLAGKTGEGVVLNYSSNNGTISFLNGTDGVLTTNFTNIDMLNPSTNTRECLGIEHITVEYDSWQYPQVTVKFVDVRGATVMSPMEQTYQNEQGNGSFYKALFTFPYPLFKLKVKGFYGRGATYYLAVEDTKIDFETETGNFNITVKFIGMMYRIYTDIPMTYLCIAPFTESGKEYWDGKVADGTFMFTNSNGVKTPMCTFPELRLRIAKAAQSQEIIETDTEGQQISTNISEQQSKLLSMRDSCPLNNWTESSGNYYILTGNTDGTGWIRESIDNYLDIVSGYDETYNVSTNVRYMDSFVDLAKYGTHKKKRQNKEIITILFERDKNGTMSCSTDGRNLQNYREWIYGKKEIEQAVDNYSHRNIGQSFEVHVLPDAGSQAIDRFINTTLVNEIKKLDSRNQENLDKYKRMHDAAMEKALGFRPSVKNIFDLAFAHMDTFTHTFYGHMANIKNQMDNNDEARRVSMYAMEGGRTDLTKDELCLPPFTGFYKEQNMHTTKVGEESTTYVSIWPEDMPFGYKLEEVGYVKELLNASKLYIDQQEKVDAVLAALSGTTEEGNRKKGGSGEASDLVNAPSADIYDFIPLTTYDLVNKDNMSNPYAYIASLAAANDSAMEGSILETFALRAFYYLCTNTDNAEEAKAFGRLEGLNFIKGVGLQSSDEFVKFITSYGDNKHEKSEKRDFITSLTSEEATDITKAWRFNAANANNALFKKVGSNLQYNLYKVKDGGLYSFIPMANFNPIKVKEAFSRGDGLKNDTGYCNTINYKGSPDNSFVPTDSFHLFDSRDYINTLYSIIEQECQTKDGGGEYAELAKQSRTLKNYKNNVDNIFNESTYHKGAIVDGEGKNIKGTDLKDMMNKTHAEQEGCYIKYPAMVNEKKDSLFDDPLYRMQTDIKAKALLFLNAMPVVGGNCGIDLRADNGVTLKARLLREGAFYWREAKVIAGTEPVVFSDEYKIPSVNESFYNGQDDSTYDTYHPLKSNSIKTYKQWRKPYGTTPSRVNKLIAAFEEWAANDYASVEPLLANDTYYGTDKKGNRSKDNGLDLTLAMDTANTDTRTLNAKAIQKFLRKTFFQVSTVLDYYDGIVTGSHFQCSSASMKSAFDGFMDELNKYYGDTLKEMKKNPEALSVKAASAIAEDPFNNKDLHLATYLTLKSLYDKWLCNPYKGEYTWTMGMPNNDFDSFKYLDVFYHDIGLNILANVTKVMEWINMCLPSSSIEIQEGATQPVNKSLYEFLADIAQHTGGMLLAFPQRIGACDEQYMADMFRAMPFNSEWETDSSSFCFMYTYKPSEHLGMDEYEDDGVDLSSQEIIGALADDGYAIPAFGVTYAKQNQSFFKNISLNTENAGVTEASLAATFNIVAKGSESMRESTMYGQDLYKVRTSYAYQCEFDMMGDAQIMPLMYFQLNNIPFWRGAYVIYKVSHQISAGEMTTHVTGVRINKNSLPLADSTIITAKDTPDDKPAVVESAPLNNTPMPSSGQTDIAANPNVDISKMVPDASNITPQKPLISLTPSHSPTHTSKNGEWWWSSMLIDNYIIPKLEKLTFKDGTSYAQNIYRANKRPIVCSNKRDGGGYGLNREVGTLVKNLGSDCVISVAIHWNGNYGQYHATYCGVSKEDNSGPIVKRREDSVKFAKFMQQAARNVINRYKNGEFPTMTDKAMLTGENLGAQIRTLKQRFNENGVDVTDPGVRCDCACVLTENWFPNYPQVNESYYCSQCSELTSSDRRCDTMENGKYKVMQGWLLSEEGMQTISDMHVEGIKNYIDSLS